MDSDLKRFKQEELADEERINLMRSYEDGTGVGTVNEIRNVNVTIWKDFKDISRWFCSNSEGATLGMLVNSWLSNPVNYARLMELRDTREQRRKESLEKKR